MITELCIGQYHLRYHLSKGKQIGHWELSLLRECRRKCKTFSVWMFYNEWVILLSIKDCHQENRLSLLEEIQGYVKVLIGS